MPVWSPWRWRCRCRSHQLPDRRDDIIEHRFCQRITVQKGKKHVQDIFRDMKRFALQKSRVGRKLVCEGSLNFPVEGLGLRVYFYQLVLGHVEGEEEFWKMLI